MFTGTVERATASDSDRVARVLGRAFQQDPVISWIFPDADDRARRATVMFAMLVNRFHLRYGSVLLAGDRAAPAGAAVWDPPGAHQTAGEVLRAVPAGFAAMGLAATRRGATLTALFERATPKPPHWYLAYVGTDPARQGEGVGSALLRPMLEHCDAIGMPAYLECSDEQNVGFYERLGFAVTGEVTLPAGPRVPTMWRA